MALKDKHFKCSLLRAIVSVPYCQESRYTKEICKACSKPDYLANPDYEFIDIEKYLEENPSTEGFPPDKKIGVFMSNIYLREY